MTKLQANKTFISKFMRAKNTQKPKQKKSIAKQKLNKKQKMRSKKHYNREKKWGKDTLLSRFLRGRGRAKVLFLYMLTLPVDFERK